jgi:phospholipid N-methyltransferase
MRHPLAKRLSGPVGGGSETLEFLRAVIRHPSRVGAVAPSGRSLARLITGELTGAHAPIVELGPGTGSFTQELIARGIPEDALALIEAEATFAANLRVRFPRARVLAMNAANLDGLSGLFEEPAGAVVSGLPLLSMPPEEVAKIVKGAFRHLRDGGVMYQFTYLPRCPVPKEVMAELGLTADWFGSAWLNLPPAFAFRLRRASLAQPESSTGGTASKG